MSRKYVKKYNTYQQGPKTENEPEEGEIVDEYDLIVSSEEEFCMRQRIRELEAENEEIEQIAVISRSYVDKIDNLHSFENRAALVPTDVSSISSTEFVTPKKRKRRKSREHNRRHCHRQHRHEHNYTPRYDQQQLPLKSHSKRTRCKRRQKLFAKNHKKIHSDRLIHREANVETLSFESLESSDSSSLTETDNYCRNGFIFKRKEDSFKKGKCITRDTLRFAVARNTNESRLASKMGCLKDKLLGLELVGNTTNANINGAYAFVEGSGIHNCNNEDDDDVQVIENYPEVQTIDEDSTDSMEEKELRLIALKSAVLRKHMARKVRNAESAYSPTDFDEMLSSGTLRQEKLDNISVADLEAEDSQSACVILSPEASPQLAILDDQDVCEQMVDCKPVDMDIANSDSEDAIIDNWSKDVDRSLPKCSLESYDFVKNSEFDFYMQKLHELPPPPPGVDDYGEVPPPPPYHMLNVAESHDEFLDKENLTLARCPTEEIENQTRENKLTNFENVISFSVTDEKEKETEDEEDEEEEALRALLLSKFQSPKNHGKKSLKENAKRKQTSNTNELAKVDACKTNPTEIILKEAVKRLKIHSQAEHYKEEASVDFCNKNKSRRDERIQEYSENKINSLGLLDKLRNRLNIHQSQVQVINTDNFESDSKENMLEPCISSPYNRDSNENRIGFNSSEVTSRIDISDITRRLQKIKENVLNSNYNMSSKDTAVCQNSMPIDRSPSDFSEVTENGEKFNQSSTKNDCQLNKAIRNNFLNIVPVNELNTTLAQTKTVEANFNATTNQTTFKITITNRDVLSSEDIADYKENDTKNVPKKSVLKGNGNIKSNIVLSRERFVKVAEKIPELSTENNALVNTSSAMSEVVVNENKVTNRNTLLRTTKIIKPNKIINANLDLKLKQIPQANESILVVNTAKPDTNQLSHASENSRLITSIDQVKHMYKIPPFIISLQNSSNESSEDDWGGSYDCLHKPLHEYNDNASPLSLNLESPSFTPLRSNSPVETSVEGVVVHTDLDSSISKTNIHPSHKEKTVDIISQANLADHGEKINKTPLAVRHLPAAAQSEYRRLVHRMKLLENKRKLSEKEKGPASNKKLCEGLQEHNKDKDKTESTSTAPKSSLVKKVLLRNANNSTSAAFNTSDDTPAANGSHSSTKRNKSNVLRAYENIYIKVGAGIVNNLDKSLKLVEEAKKAKLAKLKLENRLKELKAEMDILQAKYKEEQQKISHIYPSICTTNDIITSLKQKRSKVYKAALTLGKTLKGEEYRLNNDLKEIINTKSNMLATEIKIVNSLRVQDIKNFQDVKKSNLTSSQQILNKSTQIEDCKIKSKKNYIETKLSPSTTATNGTEHHTKICKEEEDQNNLKPTVESNYGGNTEFQNLGPNDRENHHDSVGACQSDNCSELNKPSSENGFERTLSLSPYISPLEHLRNMDSDMDPNGVVCPYDLMGNCEDGTCKFVHITPKTKT